jgi:tetratricopeptide (TPR) repeat protein
VTAAARAARIVGWLAIGAVGCRGADLPPQPSEAQRLNAEGLRRLDRGEADAADDLFRAALQEAELTDDLQSQAEAWNNRGALAFARGRCDEAWQFHGAALRVHGLRGVRDEGELRAHVNLATVLLACGRRDEARREATEAERLAVTLPKEQTSEDGPKVQLLAAQFLLEDGNARGAAEQSARVAKDAHKNEDDATEAAALAIQGTALEREGQLVEARARLEEGLTLDRKRQAPVQVATDLRALGRVAEAQRDWGRASAYLVRSARIARRLGALDAAAVDLEHAVELAKRAGSKADALAAAAELDVVKSARDAARVRAD